MEVLIFEINNLNEFIEREFLDIKMNFDIIIKKDSCNEIYYLVIICVKLDLVFIGLLMLGIFIFRYL